MQSVAFGITFPTSPHPYSPTCENSVLASKVVLLLHSTLMMISLPDCALCVQGAGKRGLCGEGAQHLHLYGGSPEGRRRATPLTPGSMPLGQAPTETNPHFLPWAIDSYLS